jgi:hypothetical protein
MQIIPTRLKPAQNEVQWTAHDQDLIEIPKRARLDTESEYAKGLQDPEVRVQVNPNNP